MTVRFAGAAALVALGLAASPAIADGGWLGVSALGWQQTPGFFVAPGVEGGFQRLPRWTSPLSTGWAARPPSWWT